ncbi:hypothetical protein BKA83DRAFT_4314588 [Pisolithus microcarpus]|nr:hypothetical protein BKA83DRAFT_4314588 [Pisolithus microcarpus]
MPSPSPTDDENPPRRDPGNSTFTHNPFHFHHTTTTALYPVHPQHHHHPQPRWDTTTTQSTSSAPDTVPTYDSAVHTSRLTGYHPLGTWNVPFPAMGSHTGEVYYPTAYNVVDTFPIVQTARGHALHPYPHAYSNASHQMAPSPSRHQRRDIYGGMHENEAAAPQAGQRHHQRTDPEQSNPQSIIHQRTQELLGQTTLSSSLSADRHDATTEYRVASGGGGVAMLGGGENEAGSSSTVHVGSDHVGLPFLLGSVGGPFYGVPPSIGDVMGKPNTGAVTGTTSTTAHVGDMPNSRISQGPISASTSALEHHPHNLVSESRVPSTRPSSPMGGFVRCTSPHGNIQAPVVTDSGPDSGSGGSLQTHPQSHVESQSSHSHSHSQNLHINPQSSHAQPYIHTHPSSYIHPRSHSSLSPASYGSYPTTGEHSTTGSSTSEYPTTTPSLDGYPTGGGYPPSASLVEQYPHPTTTTTTGCVTVEERRSLSRQTDGNAETTTTTRGGYGAGYGHGHSESLSTVRGSMTSSQHYRDYEPSSYSMSVAPPPPTTHGRDPGPHLCQPGSASGGGRRVHQYPNPARRREQASMTRSNSRGQSLGGGGDNATMGGATAKTGKPVLMDNAPAIAVPTEGGGGGGDSDDDSDGDDEEGDDGHGDGEPLTGPGGSGPGSRGGPEVGGGREQGNTGGGGGIGPRK